MENERTNFFTNSDLSDTPNQSVNFNPENYNETGFEKFLNLFSDEVDPRSIFEIAGFSFNDSYSEENVEKVFNA